jgi:hypothetical protein
MNRAVRPKHFKLDDKPGAASIFVGIAGVESIKRNASVNLTDLRAPPARGYAPSQLV